MKELVEKRCRRAIAIVLSANDSETMDQAARHRLRKVVMDQFNDFAALVVDVLESVQGETVMNELWFEKLDALHSDLKAAVSVLK